MGKIKRKELSRCKFSKLPDESGVWKGRYNYKR